MAQTDPVELPDDFERLLREELSVEPSPAFVARVRADASAVRLRPVWTRWLLPLAGAAALAVAALVWMPSPDKPHASLLPSGAPPPVIARSTPPRVASREPEPAHPVASPPRAVRTRAPGPDPATATSSFAVIVDQNQRAALRTLVAMIDQGRLTAEAFAKTTPQSTEAIADQMVPITIAPVPVSTIAPGGVLQNDTQRK
jgi:hypothetical protein